MVPVLPNLCDIMCIKAQVCTRGVEMCVRKEVGRWDLGHLGLHLLVGTASESKCRV